VETFGRNSWEGPSLKGACGAPRKMSAMGIRTFLEVGFPFSFGFLYFIAFLANSMHVKSRSRKNHSHGK
jgi:hypothetical protein